MILSVWADNFGPFSSEVEMDYAVKNNSQRFSDNTFHDGDLNVVKASCLYGTNNVGKTWLINAISVILSIMKGNKVDFTSLVNIPNGVKKKFIVSLGISFLIDKKTYAFEIKYNAVKDNKNPAGFIYEKFEELHFNSNENFETKLRKGTIIYEKKGKEVKSDLKKGSSLVTLLSDTSPETISLFQKDENQYPEIKNCRDIFKKFTDSVIIYKTYDTRFMDLVNLYKNNKEDREEISKIITRVDAEIKDFQYAEPVFRNQNGEIVTPSETDSASQMSAMFSLVSVHEGFAAPSVAIDSRGTIQIGILSGHIVDALKRDKTLIVDEIDNGLHYRITRALINMFNNGTNHMGQLIFTTHDTNLLNTKTIFRKDQIWFMDKEDDKRYLYSLSEFDSNKDGVRAEADIEKMYKNGYFGAIPKPELFESMLSISRANEDARV